LRVRRLAFGERSAEFIQDLTGRTVGRCDDPSTIELGLDGRDDPIDSSQA